MTVGNRRRTIAGHELSYEWAQTKEPGGHKQRHRAAELSDVDDTDTLFPPQVRITLYFSDRRCAGPYVVAVPADGALDAAAFDPCEESPAAGARRAYEAELDAIDVPRRTFIARAG